MNDLNAMNQKMKEEQEKARAERMARHMMLDMISLLVPQEHRALFQLPNALDSVQEKLAGIMQAVKDINDLDKSAVFAQAAITYLACVGESIEAFIEQNKPSDGETHDQTNEM